MDIREGGNTMPRELKVRRTGRPKLAKARTEVLAIQVSPDFKSKLGLYVGSSGEHAGEYLERMARRDLDDRVARIIAGWPFPGREPQPPTLPGAAAGLDTTAA
jgi:hypothetical protein